MVCKECGDEVEELVKEKSGKDGLHKKKLEKELSDLRKRASEPL